MNQAEIKQGVIYSNGKGRERLVLKLVSCPRYLMERYCVQYKVVKGTYLNRIFTITRRKFAAWAQCQLKEN